MVAIKNYVRTLLRIGMEKMLSLRTRGLSTEGGIEPLAEPWKGSMLPLHHARLDTMHA